ncbi:MAG TPA: hypothetical protein VL486_16830 [Verrucomicrobiae bacterium]|nr:hypothetical protein [Verrucomicrobiae bacterium]
MNELNRLYTQLFQRARSIRTIVQKLHELRYPSDNPLLLANLIAGLAEAVEEETLAHYKETPVSPEDLKTLLRLAIVNLERLGSDLRFVSRATTHNTPWSLICPVEGIGQQLHPGSIFIVRPQWHYNYSVRERLNYYRKSFSNLLPKDSLDKALRVGPKIERLYVTGLPYIDRLTVLMHVLLGHELGHPIEKAYFDQEQTKDFLPALETEVLKELRFPSDRTKLDLLQMTAFMQMLDRIRELRRRALAELICDLVCVNLFGLGGLFATEQLGQNRGLDNFKTQPTGEHYPPWRYRIRTMSTELPEDWLERFLEEGCFDETVRAAVQAKARTISSLTGEESDKKALAKVAETRIAYQSVESAIPTARSLVKRVLRKHGFNLDDLVGATNADLLERLENWIPPDVYMDKGNEVSASFRAVLNVGWVRWVCAYEAIAVEGGTKENAEKYLARVDALNRMVLKALEYIDIRAARAKNTPR